MTHLKSPYWIVTGLMAAFMLMAAIPDLLRVPQAIAIFGHLGYPAYLLPFLGTAKTLGIITVLVPSVRRLKEWAYAGLVFDVTGALYSHLSVGDPPGAWAAAAIGLLLVSGSYLFYRQSLNLAGDHAFPPPVRDRGRSRDGRSHVTETSANTPSH